MAAHRSIGDAKRASGDHEGALVEYKAFEKIASRLVDEDDRRPVWKRLLGHAYQRQGDVLLAQGKLQPALTAYADYLSLVGAARPRRPRQQQLLTTTYRSDTRGSGTCSCGWTAPMRRSRTTGVYLERASTLAKKVPVPRCGSATGRSRISALAMRSWPATNRTRR